MKRHFKYSIFIAFFGFVILCLTHAFSSGQSEKKDVTVLKGHEMAVTDLAFSPDGQTIVSSSLDGTVRLWDVPSGKQKLVLDAHTDEVYAVEMSADGKWIVSCGYDKKVIVFNSAGKTVHQLDVPLGWSADIALSPDSRHVAAWSMDGFIYVWDIVSGEQIKVLEGQKYKWGMVMKWSPDARYLACGRIEISLWDVETGEKIKDLKGHKNFVRGLSYTLDGKTLASAGMDKMVRVWNCESGELVYDLEPEGFTRMTRNGAAKSPITVPVIAVAFSPDGKLLVTGGAGRALNLWDAATGNPVRDLIGHKMTVTAVVFSPDGRQIASSSLDKTIRIWPIN